MRIAGYQFKDENLLKIAFTHSSFSKDNYERIEYLGDSIIDFLVAEYFYNNTNENEGNLTKLRANFVSEKYLSKVFDQLDISEHIILGKSYKGEISIAIKADIIEALIAGIYLDCKDINIVRNIVYNLLNLDSYKNIKSIDYKSQLQEFIQSKNKRVCYRLLSKSGLSHNPIWTMGVYLDNVLIGQGEETSKHKAEQIAAKQALYTLKGDKL